MSEEINQTQNTPPQEASSALGTWELQIQQRANALLAQRIGPLKEEIERLQASVTDISARLLEQARPETTEEESSSLLDSVREWFRDSSSKAEEDFTQRLEQARAEAAAAAREEAEREFQSQLEQKLAEKAQELQAKLEEQEAAFTSRLESERAEWQESASQASESELQRQLLAVKTDADIAARQEIEAQLSAKDAEFQRRLETACAEAAGVARRESDAQIEDLREQLEASRKALTLAVASAQNTTFDTLRAAIEDIDGQRSQSDTLTALVRRAAGFAPRVVFFVIKGGDAVGWKATGFTNGLSDDTAKMLSVRANTPSLLQQALSNFQTAVGTSASPGENSTVLGPYGSPAPEKAIAVPLVVRGKAAAVLYADSGTQPENALNMAAIETLMRVASMGIELLPSRRGTEPAARPAAPAPAPASNLAPAVVSAPAPPPAPVESAPAPSLATPALEGWQRPYDQQISAPTSAAAAEPKPEALESAESQASQPTQIEAEPYLAPDTEEMPAIQIDKPAPPLSVVPPPPPAPPAPHSFMQPHAETASPVQAEAPTERVIPEPAPVSSFNPSLNPATSFNVGNVGGGLGSVPSPEPPRPPQPTMSVPTPASETEQRAHNDARRFARLLVSEIKLYNAAKVNDGRRNFDLYDRLKDEIDRSRKVYDKRVSPAVAARFDYFYDELVQTLAEGDPAKLGDSCPGPVVLAS